MPANNVSVESSFVRRIRSHAQASSQLIAQLAALIMNGRHISSGQYFPIGWANNGDRLLEIATDDLLRKANRLADVWGRRAAPSWHGRD